MRVTFCASVAILALYSCKTANQSDNSEALTDRGPNIPTFKVPLEDFYGTYKVDVPDAPARFIFNFPSAPTDTTWADNHGFGNISCKKIKIDAKQLVVDVDINPNSGDTSGFCDKLLGGQGKAKDGVNLLIDHRTLQDSVYGNLLSHYGPQYFYMQRNELHVAINEMAKVKLEKGDCKITTSGSYYNIAMGSANECEYSYDSSSTAIREPGRQKLILRKL